MNLLLQRLWYTDKSTVGELSVEGVFQSYTLELPKKDGLPGSCILAGTYSVIFAPSPKFESSQDPWVMKYAKEMPRLQDIPNRSGILIHWGNEPEETEGCILVGRSYSPTVPDLIQNSRVAFADLYAKIRAEEGNLTIEVMG